MTNNPLIRLLIAPILFLVSNLLQAQMPDTSRYYAVDFNSPEKYTLAGVEVTGVQFLDKDILINNIAGLKIGQIINIPGDEISHAIDQLWKQKLFSDIKVSIKRIDKDKIYLIVNLEERPRLSRFTITGVRKGQAKTLKDELKIKAGDPVTEFTFNKIETNIYDYYAEKGFLNVKTTITERNDTSQKNSAILEINVNKGEKVRIGEIAFSGNLAIDEKKLRRLLKKTKQYRKWLFVVGAKFKEEEYKTDKERIIARYNTMGFRDANIEFDSVYAISSNRLKVEIKISEGRKYYFRNITWVGNTKYTSEQLNQVLNIKRGDVFDQSVLDKKLTYNENGMDVSSIYMDDGYLFFNVSPVEVNVDNDSIDLEMRIYEGKQAIINKVTLKGNTRTSDHVVMREIRTRPGDNFSRSNIIRSQRELAQLGYFDPEKSNVIPTPNPASGTVDLEYIVEEKPSDQIELQGGWGGGQLVGTLGLSLNNFSSKKAFKKDGWRPIPTGDGQRLSIRAQSTGKFFQSYNISFTEPWMGGKKPNTLNVGAFYSMYGDNLKNTDPNRRRMKILGANIGLGKRVKWPDDFFTVNYSLGLQQYNIYNWDLLPDFNSGISNNLNLKTTIARNSVDAPIYPRSGSSFTLTSQITPPYSLFRSASENITMTQQEKFKLLEYHKWRFDAVWYTGIGKKFVLQTRAGYGFMGQYNKNYGIPPFERFVMGGSELTAFQNFYTEIVGLRGYQDRSITQTIEKHTGGSTIFNRYTMELRYPISLNPSATVYVLGFLEAGKAWDSFKKYNPFDLYRSGGAGVRVFLPMFGLLGLDYGYGFDNPTGLQKGNWHFTIGQMF